MAKSFNAASVRLLGAVLMFVGLLLVVMRNTMTQLFVTVVALLLLVGGFYLVASGIRLLAAKSGKGKKNATAGALMLVGGLVAIALGVLALLYRGQVANWILVAVGAAIALYGLVMLIVMAVAQRGPHKVVMDVVLAVLTMVVGVLIAILVIPQVGGAVNGLCYYLFGSLAIAVGAVELVMY